MKNDNIIGKALKLSDLLNYHKNSVVSRTIIDKKIGTVTLFAFDKDQGLSEHTAPYDALIFIVDGEAKVFIEGKPRLVKNNDMIIMPANKPHSLCAEKKFKMVLVMIRA